MKTNINDKRIKARKRVEALKGFYTHLTVYIVINLFIVVGTVYGRMNSGESFSEAFFSFATFSAPIFWGVGLAFHAAKVFSYSPFFSKDWEQRQIQKYMDEDRKEAEKYR